MKNILFTILAFFFLASGFSQPWMDLIPKEKVDNSEVNFFDIQQAFNEYWQDREIEKGKGWKQFRRWEHFMSSRVDESGFIPNKIFIEEYNNMLLQRSSQNKDIQSTWTSRGPVNVPSGPATGIGRLNCVAFDPVDVNTFWVGAPAGGLWKTTNGGSTWSTTTDLHTNLGVSDIAINPLSPDIMYIATGDGDGSNTYTYGILKSTDAGVTWSGSFNLTVSSGNTISRLLINPDNPDIVIAAMNAGIYATTNAGVSWYSKQGGQFKDIEFKPGDPTIVYGSTKTGEVYRSIDEGQNWTMITSGLPAAGVKRVELAVTEADAAVVYALFTDMDDGYYGLYKSTNSGVDWSLRSSSPNILNNSSDGSGTGGQGWYDLGMAVSPTNSNQVFVGGVNVWKSNNSGSSWSLIGHWYGGGGADYVHADHHMFKFKPGTSLLYTASDGGLQRISATGSIWTDLSDGIEITQFYRIGLSAGNANLLLGGTQDNGTNILQNTNWSEVRGGDGMECIIDYSNPSVMYSTVYYGAISKSYDSGNSWYDVTPNGNADGAWVTPYVMHPTNQNTLYAGYSEVYRTSNGGSSWSAISSNLTGGENLTSIAVAPSDPNYIYAATDNKIWRTTNQGSAWTDITGTLPTSSAYTNISYITISDSDPDVVFISISGYSSGNKVYTTTNGGISWGNYSTGLPNVPANCIVYEGGTSDAVYVGTDLGVFYRNSGLSTWEDYSSGLPNVIVRELEIHYGSGKLVAGTYGRGIWEVDLKVTSPPPIADFIGVPTTVILGSSVNFADISTSNPTEWSWSFQGGTPSWSNLQNPVIAYNTVGTYQVSLNVTNDGGGDSELKTDYITVIDDPNALTADFAASSASIYTGQSVDFTDMSVGAPTNWTWGFSGGTPSLSNSQNPVGVAYNTAGVYSVSLRVQNATNSDSITKTNYITVTDEPLTADFTASSTSIYEGESVTFIDMSVGTVVSWDWLFTGGAPSMSSDQNPVITYSTSGVFLVSLTVSNGTTTDNETKSSYITVVPNPNALASDFIASSTTVIAGQSIDFNDLSTGSPVSWYWSFNGAETISYQTQNPIGIVYNTIGVFDVSLNVSDGNNNSIELKTDYITVIPDPDVLGVEFSASSTVVIEGQTVDFTDLSSGTPNGWFWTFEGGVPVNSSAQNPTSILYSTIGSYDVSLNISNGIDNDAETKAGYITVLPDSNILYVEFQASATTIFEGESIDFTDLSTGDPIGWYWTFTGGNPNSSTVQNPLAITYDVPGTYNVSLNITDGSSGELTTKNNYITVLALPEPLVGDFSADATSIFEGESVNFTDLSTGSPTSWYWTFNGGTPSGSTDQNPSLITYNTAGTYSVTLNVSNGTESDVVQKLQYITVSAAPVPLQADFSSNTTTIYAGGSVDFYDETNNSPVGWYWTFTGGTPINAGAQNPVGIVYANPGTFAVNLNVTDGSESDDTTKVNYINVLSPLSANFSASSTTITVGESIDFTDLSSGSPNSWNWSFAGGLPSTSSNQNPVNIVYNSVGVYTVVLSVGDGLTTDEEMKTAYITVNEPQNPLDANFIANQTSIIEGDSVNFSDLSTGNPTSWSWIFMGGSPLTSNAQNPSGILYDSPGSYLVSLTVGDGTSSDQEIKTDYIIVNTSPSGVTADFVADQTTIYVDQSVDYFDLSTGNPTSWSWNFSGGNPVSSVDQHPSTIFYDTPGQYTVSLSVYNSISADTVVKTGYITVLGNEQLDADFIASDTIITEGDSISFMDISTGDPTSWQWTFTGANTLSSSEQHPSDIVYSTPGVYTVTLEISDGTNSDTETKTGFIQVDSASAIKYIDETSINIYPNPTDGILYIDPGSVADVFSRVELYNVSGDKVLSIEKIRFGRQLLKIDMSKFASGVYYLCLTGNGITVTREIVLE